MTGKEIIEAAALLEKLKTDLLRFDAEINDTLRRLGQLEKQTAKIEEDLLSITAPPAICNN